MRDLQDLDRVWAELDARADAHPLSDAMPPPRRHHGRRIALMTGAGATMAAVAVGVVSVSNGNSTPRVPAPGTPHHTQSAPVTVGHEPKPKTVQPNDDGPGWTTLPTGHYLVIVDGIQGAYIRSVIGVGNDETLLQPGDQYQEVQVTGPANGLVIKVNAPGYWSPSGGQHLIFDGRDAYYGPFLRHPEIPGHPVPPRMSLAWQYQPGAWATIGTLTDDAPITLEDAEHYARLVKIAVGDPLPDPLPQDR